MITAEKRLVAAAELEWIHQIENKENRFVDDIDMLAKDIMVVAKELQINRFYPIWQQRAAADEDGQLLVMKDHENFQ